MGLEEAAEARAQADVDLSPLVDSAAKGFTVELVGRDRLPGGETWKLGPGGNGSGSRSEAAPGHLAQQVSTLVSTPGVFGALR